MRDIWREYHQLNKELSDYRSEVMREYMNTVYHPKLLELQKHCGEQGHMRGKFHENGLGWCWYYCNRCGARMDVQSYE